MCGGTQQSALLPHRYGCRGPGRPAREPGALLFITYPETGEGLQPDIILSTANHLNLYFALFRNRFPDQVKFIARRSSVLSSINTQRAKWPALYPLAHQNLLPPVRPAYLPGNIHAARPGEELPGTGSQNRCVIQCRGDTTPVAFATDPGRAGWLPSPVFQKKRSGAIDPRGGGCVAARFVFISLAKEQKGQNWRSDPYAGTGRKLVFAASGPSRLPGWRMPILACLVHYYEGFPNALLEAQALGIPAQAFDVPGGISGNHSPGENGLLVEDNDLIGFAAAITETFPAFNRQEIIENTQNVFCPGHDTKMEQLLTEL